MGVMNDSAAVDTIVRFHDVRRLGELHRCLFSAVAQTYQPVHVHVVTQRFSSEELDAVRRSLEPLHSLGTGAAISIHNWTESEPKDARSHLINHGIRQAEGRFLAFLDYDDIIYPEAYELLTNRLSASDAAIVFASVRVMRLQVFEPFYRVLAREKAPWGGSSLLDLFRENLAPIHSYMIDRTRVDPELLYFDVSLSWEEDYEFLMRVCARHRADFGMLSTCVGDYFFKTDGSNSVPTESVAAAQRHAEYMRVRKEIDRRRDLILVSDEIRQELGLSGAREVRTVRDVLSAALARNGVPHEHAEATA
jgi:Glycosyltransferase like family 2